MPAPISYSATRSCIRWPRLSGTAGKVKGFGPDAKSQVTLQYENGKPVRATSVVVSTQHTEELDQDADA